MGPGPRGPGNKARWNFRSGRFGCFNGAGAARSRKWSCGGRCGIDSDASMGPGPRGPGNVFKTFYAPADYIGFNGAGAARSRK